MKGSNNFWGKTKYVFHKTLRNIFTSEFLKLLKQTSVGEDIICAKGEERKIQF